MANITDCRSVAMSSILIRTAEERSIRINGSAPVFQTGGECSIHSCCSNRKMLAQTYLGKCNTFNVGVLGSDPSGITKGMNSSMAQRRLVKPRVESSLPAGRQGIFLHPQCL